MNLNWHFKRVGVQTKKIFHRRCMGFFGNNTLLLSEVCYFQGGSTALDLGERRVHILRVSSYS